MAPPVQLTILAGCTRTSPYWERLWMLSKKMFYVHFCFSHNCVFIWLPFALWSRENVCWAWNSVRILMGPQKDGNISFPSPFFPLLFLFFFFLNKISSSSSCLMDHNTQTKEKIGGSQSSGKNRSGSFCRSINLSINKLLSVVPEMTK